MTARRRGGSTALLASIGAVGTLLILVRESAYGIRLGPDSRAYVSTARNLLDGAGLVDSHGVPIDEPPIFPLTLAVAARALGLDVIEAAGYVNALAFGLTAFVAAVWLRSRIRSPWLVLWAGCACVLSIRLARFGASALTEMPFILLVVVSLYLMDRFLSTGRRRLLLLAALACTAACLTRYIGLSLIGAGVLVLLTRKNTALGERLANAAGWSFVPAVFLGAWELRNLLASGSLLKGGGGCCDFSVLVSLDRAADEFARWIFGETGFHLLSVLSAGAAAATAAGDATAAALTVKLAALLALAAGIGYALVRRRPGPSDGIRSTLAVSLGFLSAYALFLAIYLPAADLTLPTRYLAPMFPPLLVAATAVLDELLSDPRASKPRSLPDAVKDRPGAALVSLLLLLWLVLQARASYDDVGRWLDEGFGYSSRQRAGSALVRHLRVHPPGGRILSNNAPWFYFLPGFPQHVEGLRLRFAQVKSQLHDPRGTGGETFVALFYRDFWRRSYDFDLEDLSALPGMEVAAVPEDGILFRRRAPSHGAPTAREDTAVVRAFQALVRDARLLVRARFDVYLDEEDGRLIYVREECGDGRRGYPGPRFFLRVFPVHPAPLSGRRPERAFARLDFRLNHYGGSIGGRCIATRMLPDGEIAAIETGQHVRGREIWSTRLVFGD